MKWLTTLLLALIASIAGIMLTQGAIQHIFQLSFFAVLVLCFFTLAVDFSRT